jgi:hypothetical protein
MEAALGGQSLMLLDALSRSEATSRRSAAKLI